MIELARIKQVAVVGAGTMGQGIAQICATAGYNVFLYDIDSALTDRGLAHITQSLGNAVTKGKLTEQEKVKALRRITATNDLNTLQAELVIEAVVEKLEVKQKIFAALEKINDSQAIFTTNTSSISITQIGSALKRPERFAGLHFFNPAPIMKLVEIITGAGTNPEVVTVLTGLAALLGKTPVVAKDSPGFIVNRVARHFYVESLKALEENVADVPTIDQLMKSTGFKMGPFELMDLIGVDTNFSVTTSIYNAFYQDPKFRPSPIQQQKVNAGHHGRKSGRGFYDYNK